MKNRKLFPIIAMLVIVSLSCNFLFPQSSQDGVVLGDLSHIFDNLPAYDPAAPLTSSGATALEALAELDPSVTALKDDVQASERAALNALLADLQIQLGADNSSVVPLLSYQSGSAKFSIPVANGSLPAGYELPGDLEGSGSLVFDASFVAILASQAIDELAVHAKSTEGKYDPGPTGDATNNTGIKFKKNPDGSTYLEIVSQTDASKESVSAKTDAKVSIDGWRCPNDAGQVSFTVKELFHAESGGASYTADLTAYVRAEVNDNAELAGITIDINQSTQKVKGGQTVDVESGFTNKNGITSNQRLINSSQAATPEDISSISATGEAVAYNMALGALLFAQSNWQKGGCVKIEATSPGTVQPGSTTDIPVSVHHRIDGSEVSSKLTAALSGGQSVDPTKLAKTPGTLTYTAPNENGKSATILLTATSKRGKETLELTANTGGAAYHIFGKIGDLTEDGYACDATKPFTIHGTITMDFTPADEKSGTFKFSGGPFGDTGGGSYTIGNGSMKITGSGCVDPSGTYCNSGEGTLNATPIDPATCVSQ